MTAPNRLAPDALSALRAVNELPPGQRRAVAVTPLAQLVVADLHATAAAINELPPDHRPTDLADQRRAVATPDAENRPADRVTAADVWEARQDCGVDDHYDEDVCELISALLAGR